MSSNDRNRPYPEGVAWDEAWRQRQRADANEKAAEALRYVVKYGVYAVPAVLYHHVYWIPKKVNSPDPKKHIAKLRGTGGWSTWEDAVIAYGMHLDQACNDCDACLMGAVDQCVYLC